MCLSTLNTTLQNTTAGMFTNTPLLANPNGSEQTALLAGSNYINAGSCPA